MLNSSEYTLVERKEIENHRYTENITSAIGKLKEAIASISYSKFQLEGSNTEIIINHSCLYELSKILDSLEELKETTLYKPIKKGE